jgi:spore coat polysaccharide biosynthesis predicted glycosyltransferase SpsG
VSRVLVRVDGSRAIGLGHVRRCLTIAAGLRGAGLAPVFLTREGEPAVRAWIEAAGFAARGVSGDDLGADRDATRGAIQAIGPAALLADLPTDLTVGASGAYLDYLAALKATGVGLAIVDDLNVLDFPADLVINPNVGAEDLPYPRKDGARHLLGTRYFPCPPDVAAAGDDRIVRPRATRVLVTLGGGEAGALPARVVEGLSATREASGLEVRVLLGLGGSDRVALDRAVAAFPGRLALVDRVTDLAPALGWADLAVIAGGMTKYEAAAAGVPALVLAQVRHQEAPAERFAAAGSATYLGPAGRVDAARIARGADALLPDAGRRRGMSEAGRRLVDGRGVARVVERLAALAGALR